MDVETLRSFDLESVLNEDALSRSISLLGSLPAQSPTSPESSRAPAVIILQKTPFSHENASRLTRNIGKVEILEGNDIYQYLLGWSTSDIADVKISVISPATPDHIRKYSAQEHNMIRETPALYAELVKPYIDAFPASRTTWVHNILNHVTEVDKILYEDPSPTSGYILLPDPKWDGTTLSALYLLAIVRDCSLKSLRDLRKQHVGMLKSIRSEATRVGHEKWRLGEGKLRLYIHYQPSYYQLHVHVVTVELSGFAGMSVGQAHLLDDVISLLEVDNAENGEPSIFERLTLTYVLGAQHGLYEGMQAASRSIL